MKAGFSNSKAVHIQTNYVIKIISDILRLRTLDLDENYELVFVDGATSGIGATVLPIGKKKLDIILSKPSLTSIFPNTNICIPETTIQHYNTKPIN